MNNTKINMLKMQFNQSNLVIHEKHMTSGGGARVSSCAGLINQLRHCRFEPRIACLENTDTAILGDWWTGVGGHRALNCLLV